ncbi:hypothetical protein CJU90_6664 [Yarrowia sp. C11]|nr:hypothetical protein CJU90_6664 [Yarrowia sp. C11]KAG5358761.1 hypothetical protein CKK34_5042 [Yarrowia sp. E02]
MTPDRLSLILRELRESEDSKINRLFGAPRKHHHHVPGRVTVPVIPPPKRHKEPGYVQTALEWLWRLLVQLRPILVKIAERLWPVFGAVSDVRTGLVSQPESRFANTNARRLLREAL